MGQPDPGESQDNFGIPSHCDVNDDCPERFLCTAHRCTPNEPPIPSRWSCEEVPGSALLALVGVLGLGWVRRRRR